MDHIAETGVRKHIIEFPRYAVKLLTPTNVVSQFDGHEIASFYGDNALSAFVIPYFVYNYGSVRTLQDVNINVIRSSTNPLFSLAQIIWKKPVYVLNFPIVCKILAELNAYHHPGSDLRQYYDNSPRQTLVKWLNPPSVAE
ncbi:hypothetical protein BDC45DRAFT_532057 [Circinella umbellata]|nr:hypothetical protein BDC45DRAFT_532057 [Circinella umbellata]